MSSKLKILMILFFIVLTELFYLVYISKRISVIDEDEIRVIEIKDNEFFEPEAEKEIERNDVLKPIAEDKDSVLVEENKKQENKILNTSSKLKELNILFSVPFTSQAPYAEWDDPVHQDGCEEASSLMAVSWARGENLNQAKAKKEIVAISDYQSENFGEYRDTSAEDTVKRIINGYFKYENAKVKSNINVNDIIFELANGNIVILPMDGQKLNNPYYTPPGPVRHMIVVIGYDEEKREFITNDPGTKRGEGYRYSEDVLYNAIRDYITGYHELIKKQEKTMIIVKLK